ncbi:uncharacterized protein LOC126966863 [Leptidea sinapis]|uniref:Uncharacterized protein n=1 Tax=Leptidea sinapis TaxID=189913 RepID=A0A5E4PQR8_9NEOP|nr:uncharacterized protein LOC126966863 [Leptidea sinapis]VVC87430.1 unnamed protein product [Leptidea sinapis]
MNNIPDSTAGEPSCKRQENGDAPIELETDRPLKKARFAWQVKGKYHLKNEITEVKPSIPNDDYDKPCSSSHVNPEHKNVVGNTEQNLEILGDYLLKQDFNTLDSVADCEKLLPPTTASEKLPYPRYISSFETSSNSTNESNSNELQSQSSNPIMNSNYYTEDQCIARWQARQMAKCFVDNTINRVLDNWMLAPLPPDADNNRVLALDVAEFINNLPGDNTIENEGILMAISAHGLQNTSNASSSNDHEKSLTDSQSKDMFNSSPSSPIQSDDELSQTANSNKNSDPNSSNELDCNDMQIAFYPGSSSSYKYYGENDLDNSNIECEGDETIQCSDDVIENYDFLDAAVSFAIQNKGLTSFGTDYG